MANTSVLSEMKISGLYALVKPLLLAPELQAAADVVENAGETWAPEHVIKILHKRAAEWALVTPPKEVAAASMHRQHTAQCHKWLARGTCEPHARNQCKYAHDAEFKNRPDLPRPYAYEYSYMDIPRQYTGTCANT